MEAVYESLGDGLTSIRYVNGQLLVSEVRRSLPLLRAALLVDGLVFLVAAAFNFGARTSVGAAHLEFGVPIWQAGLGEAVISVALLIAATTGRPTVAWVALVMSGLGIVFGLSSRQVEGAARDIHVILVPIAIIVLGLLIWATKQEWPRLRPPFSSRN